ncbi:MAG: tetratricopeptide repeat protein [Proteobacteria bacterium]|nr:tetratricopeptide repeat protein [Pseudomonadota bacterium]MDA1356898.1 tetratricopeptide repeat protein [Pseudomonadota bacterium]
MTEDRRGVALSGGDSASLEIYEKALRAFNIYRGDPVAIIDEALAGAPDFICGEIFRAYMHVGLWEETALAEVQAGLGRLKALAGKSNDRERAHAAALSDWAAGDWQGMRARLERISIDHPHDLLALQMGHLADFFHGDRENLRGRIARALPAWVPGEDGHNLVLGMQSFGLEECGDYGRAEDAGRRALEIEPEDSWARHAVVHVMEMQSRQVEGAAFMEETTAHWAQDDNAFAFHNWWHTALFYLDQDHVARALELYDAALRPGPDSVQLTLLDAAALLWRLHLRGEDVGTRWERLADHYENLAGAGFYAFNDMHAMLAYTAAGRGAAAEKLLSAVERAAQADGTNAEMERLVGLPVVRAMAAFGRGDYAACAELLLPIRYRAHAFGGSHAQRDIIHRTLIEAALRSGDKALAGALTQERLALKPDCPYSRALGARALN